MRGRVGVEAQKAERDEIKAGRWDSEGSLQARGSFENSGVQGGVPFHILRPRARPRVLRGKRDVE
jgi:hypothetical protein